MTTSDQPDEPQEPSLEAPSDHLSITRAFRRSRNMFVPKPEDATDIDVIVSRGILNARQNRKPETSRNRVIAGNLPAWEPMPPGESLVNRPGVR